MPAARGPCRVDASGDIAAYSDPIARITGYTSSKKGVGRDEELMADCLRSGDSSGDGVAVRIFCGDVPFLRWALRVVTGILTAIISLC